MDGIYIEISNYIKSFTVFEALTVLTIFCHRTEKYVRKESLVHQTLSK